MRKKLALVYPNMRWQKQDIVTLWDLNPSTLCLLAAMVEDFVDVTIIDAQFYDLTIDEFEKRIAALSPDYVGISLLTSEYEKSLEIACKSVKNVSKDICVIVGGVHVTILPEQVLNTIDDVDYCVLGEGEYVLRQLLLHFEGKENFPSVGVGYRNDKSVIIQEKAIVEDLGRLPRPKYDLVDFGAYVNRSQRKFSSNNPPEYPYVRMVTTRGCPCGCVFCQVEHITSKKVRARDPEDVVNELLFLKNKYGIRSVVFDEDNILMGEDGYAKRLFTKMIEKKLNMKWIATAFALFMIDDELLDLMKASGCFSVNVAIESGNKRVLHEIIKKPIKNLDNVSTVIKKIHDRGIYCIANFIIGFPGETWDEIRETILFAENCGADYVKIYAALPLFKTKLYEMCKNLGVLNCDENVAVTDWRYAQILSNEWTTNDISILRAYEWDRINFTPDKMPGILALSGSSIDEINDIRKQTRDALVFS